MAKKKIATEEVHEITNRNNEEIISDICACIPGAEILSNDVSAQLGFVSTGNFAVDFICSGKFWNGGIPMGRITEIIGPSSTGKTIIGTHILQGVQRMGGVGVLIDSESAYSAAFGEVLGLDTNKLIYLQPECLEDCFMRIIKIVEYIRKNTTDMRPIAIVYDSIAASPSRMECEKIQKGEDIGSLMGRRALICSDYLRNIAGFLSKQKAAVVVINQIRSKIGVMFGNPETGAGGGNSLEYYCSVRLDCRRRGKIADKQKRAIGIYMNVKNVKNKVAKPFREASELELFFDKGIAPTSGLIGLLVEEEKLVQGGAWYSVKDSDVKFQGKNLVETLLEHPELVDAPDRNSLENYLRCNRQSLDLSLSADLEKIESNEGED